MKVLRERKLSRVMAYNIVCNKTFIFRNAEIIVSTEVTWQLTKVKGSDRIDFSSYGQSINAQLVQDTELLTSGVGQSVTNIERVIGSPFSDTLQGQNLSGNDYLALLMIMSELLPEMVREVLAFPSESSAVFVRPVSSISTGK